MTRFTDYKQILQAITFTLQWNWISALCLNAEKNTLNNLEQYIFKRHFLWELLVISDVGQINKNVKSEYFVLDFGPSYENERMRALVECILWVSICEWWRLLRCISPYHPLSPLFSVTPALTTTTHTHSHPFPVLPWLIFNKCPIFSSTLLPSLHLSISLPVVNVWGDHISFNGSTGELGRVLRLDVHVWEWATSACTLSFASCPHHYDNVQAVFIIWRIKNTAIT